MRIVRFAAGGKVKYGLFEGEVIQGLRGSPFTRFRGPGSPFALDGKTYNPGEVRLLAPCTPSKIVGLGLNYRSHVEEVKLPVPAVPLIFLKPSTAVIGPEAEIILPARSQRVDYEGELGVVMGRRAKEVTMEGAKDYVLGYTCVNDVSERHVQRDDGQWTRSKSFDTFAPIGPWIETGIDPDDLKVETRLNGQVRQSARTGDLIFGVSELISFVSAAMTLLPGDILATGTPSGIGRMDPSDVVEISIQKIGTLKNFVSGPQESAP